MPSPLYTILKKELASGKCSAHLPLVTLRTRGYSPGITPATRGAEGAELTTSSKAEARSAGAVGKVKSKKRLSRQARKHQRKVAEARAKWITDLCTPKPGEPDYGMPSFYKGEPTNAN